MSDESADQRAAVALSSRRGRWLILATALGSGMAFLDGSVVNVALPAIGRALGGGITTQQWILDGYLLTLTALLLFGGALGDRFGRRRVFQLGLVVFTPASLGCGVAPTSGALIAARAAQGVGGALLVPGSLALIDASVRAEDRGRAVGTWAGLSGVASALGPFLGGWLVDAASWRWVFLLNVPLAAVALVVAARHVPESRDAVRTGRLDHLGACAVTVGLAGAVFVLIELPGRGWTPPVVLAAAAGVLGLTAFPIVERFQSAPLMPLAMFGSRQFAGVSVVTVVVYTGLGGALFLLALQLQQSLGYTALQAGLSLLPFTALMLLLSRAVGGLAQRIGPRLPMTVGPFFAAAGFALLTRAAPGSTYLTGVLPGVITFGFGLAITVSPLTAAVLAAVDERDVGVASGANNALSRLATLLAVAVLPLAAGLDAAGTGPLGPGFTRAMLICAGLCVAGGLVAFATVDRSVRVTPTVSPCFQQPCQSASTRTPDSRQR